ncbi:unnamed protein product [Urochloa humidicola]
MDHATSFNKAHGVVQPCDYFFANMLLLPLWKVPRGGHQYCGMCIIGSHVHLAWYIWRSDFLLCLFAIFKKTTASYQKWMCFMYPFFLQYMAAPQGHLLEGCHCCGALFVWSIIQFVCFSLPGDSVLCWSVIFSEALRNL